MRISDPLRVRARSNKDVNEVIRLNDDWGSFCCTELPVPFH